MMRALLLVIALALLGCGAPRVAPVGVLAPDPENPGAFVLNPSLPQPVAEDYEPGAGWSWLGGLGNLLPSPWREVVLMLMTGLGAEQVRKRTARDRDRHRDALRQTVAAIDLARPNLDGRDAHLDDALRGAQDEEAKRLVWEMRP